MKLIALAALALVIPQETNEAEVLYRKMEEKLSKARTIQVTCAGSAVMGEGKMTLATTLAVGEGNKLRLEAEMKSPMGSMAMRAISNGTTLVMKNERESLSNEADQKLGADLVLGFSRSGGLFCTGWLEAMADKENRRVARRKVPQAADLKLGKKEKIGDREAQSVDLTVKNVEAGEVASTLWIDLETHLPLKREIRGLHGQETLTYVETYSGFKLDEKIDETKFDLPK